jgi:hypothetical protein
MPRRLGLTSLAFLLAVGALVGGCGGDDEPAARGEATTERTDTATQSRTATRPQTATRPRERRPPAPRCEAGAPNCSAASGRIVAMETVDPDGDGDLHVVLSGGSVTFPGVSVLDVSKALRPARDPRVGDWAAGAGPVYRGSYGQKQIQVERVVFSPRR